MSSLHGGIRRKQLHTFINAQHRAVVIIQMVLQRELTKSTEHIWETH